MMNKPDVPEFPQRLVPLSENEIISGWGAYDKKPLVSIVCATYNHVRYIEDALCGFFGQKTQYPFEVIVRDDCSNDGTTDILKKYLEKYPSLLKLIINDVNQYKFGGRAFPMMISVAKGQYIAVCEGDDYWIDEYKIQKQVQFLERNQAYVMTYSSSKPINDIGMVQDICHGSKKDLTSHELMKGSSVATLTACFRNKFLENGYPSELLIAGYGDIALWAYLGQYGDGKYLENDRESIYRIHAGGVHSSASPDKRAEMQLRTSMALYQYFKNIGNTKLAKHHLRNVYAHVVDDIEFNFTFLKVIMKASYKKMLSMRK